MASKTTKRRRKDTPERIRFVPRVTRQHGVIFADAWCSNFMEDDPWDAVDVAAIMEWSPDIDLSETPTQIRYHRLTDEILNLTFRIAHDALAAAFTTAAGEVIERERERQKRENS